MDCSLEWRKPGLSVGGEPMLSLRIRRLLLALLPPPVPWMARSTSKTLSSSSSSSKPPPTGSSGLSLRMVMSCSREVMVVARFCDGLLALRRWRLLSVVVVMMLLRGCDSPLAPDPERRLARSLSKNSCSSGFKVLASCSSVRRKRRLRVIHPSLLSPPLPLPLPLLFPPRSLVAFRRALMALRPAATMVEATRDARAEVMNGLEGLALEPEPASAEVVVEAAVLSTSPLFSPRETGCMDDELPAP